jgi:lipopolysaccharide transport system permease protein
MWLDETPGTIAVVALPLVLALEGLLILGLAYFAATFQVFFHDTQHLLGITLTLLFYLTPVFYSLDAVPDRYGVLFDLNPMVHLLGAYRGILIHGEFPRALTMLLVGTASAVFVLLGYRLYVRLHYRFVQEL